MQATHHHLGVIEALRIFLPRESIHQCPLCQKEYCGTISIAFEPNVEGLQDAATLLKEIARGVAQTQPSTIVESQPSSPPKRTAIVLTNGHIMTEHGSLPIIDGTITIDEQEIPILPSPPWNLLNSLQSHHTPRTIVSEEQAEAEAESQDD